MENVEDIYPLSQMQEMMLLHAVSHRHADVLFNQFCYEIRGDLDVAAFRQAWQEILERHPVFRTFFVWQDVKRPLQIVRRDLELPFKELDWRDRSPEKQRAELDDFCRADRELGFDPSSAPLTRVAVIRLAPRSFFFIWSSHHLLVDRWCLSTIFSELFTIYEANRRVQRPSVEPVHPYRDYINWIQKQDPAAAESYWRGALRGFTEPTAITLNGMPHQVAQRDQEPERARIELSAAKSTALRDFARRHGLTLGTLFQGAWALTLNHYSGRQDVVFGTVVAGRPPDLAGVGSMVGTFINNQPVRLRLSRHASLTDWLKDTQLAQQRRSPFEYVSVAEIHNWSELSAAHSLFDSLLVWLSPEDTERPADLVVRGLPNDLRTAYPVTLGISEEARLSLQLSCDPTRRSVAPVPRIIERLDAILDAILAAEPDCCLADLNGFRGQEDYPIQAETSAGVASAAYPGNGTCPGDTAAAATEGREGIGVDLLQDLLMNEWCDVLGRSEIGHDDDFFQLGGDSLRAALLHSRISNATRSAVPLLSLFRAPTVRQMARILREEDWPLKPGILLPIRAQGHRTPLFCVASPEVNTVGYALLARHLAGDLPIHVLQSPPETGELRRLSVAEIPALAATYIAAMRAVQRAGPYRLVSMCTGAHLAVEMARQLEASNEKVAFLGIVNTWGFYTVTRLYALQRLISRYYYMKARLGELRRLAPREQLATLRQVATGRRAKAVRTVGKALGLEAAAPGSTRQRDDWIEDGRAGNEVECAKFGGVVTVFRIRKQPFWRVRDPGLGWSREAESVRVVWLSGDDHHAILREPHVKDLARVLQDSLNASAKAQPAQKTLSPT